jgi:uncharacterized membrane protein (GlpM family)
MIGQLVARFLIGGAMVALFALLGDLFRPKTFGGLFGAAPSVALATLALTVHAEGAAYAAREARSMVLGGVALLVYASAVSWQLYRRRTRVPITAIAGLLVWGLVAVAGGLLIATQP